MVCAIVTAEFLAFTKARGNDLSTPHPEFQGNMLDGTLVSLVSMCVFQMKFFYTCAYLTNALDIRYQD